MMLSAIGFWGLAAVIISGAVLTFIAYLPASAKSRRIETARPSDTTLLYQDDTLVDLAGEAPNLNYDTWSELRSDLSDRFHGLPETLDEVDSQTLFEPANDGEAQLDLQRIGKSVQVMFLGNGDGLESHLDIAMQAPFPIWRLDRDRQVVWKNTACGGEFEGLLSTPKTMPDCPEGNAVDQVRIEQAGSNGAKWYEINARRHVDGCVCYASDITETVKAQEARRAFVQTLTKTFANLTTGLAVFDRNRKLVIFNPALVDLTTLPVEFLSTTPDLMSVFDRLRNEQIMPEPRDYGTWRARIDEILTSAQCGLYEETWALPSNVTFRVTGRPHPDGAVAFLFEDISADVMLSRRHHLELEKRDAMLDRLQEAVVVLGRDDVVTLCNRAFRALFGLDPDQHPNDIRLDAVLRRGGEVYPHDLAFWRNCRDLAQVPTASTVPPILTTRHGDQVLTARLEPLPGADRMLVFAKSDAVMPALV